MPVRQTIEIGPHVYPSIRAARRDGWRMHGAETCRPPRCTCQGHPVMRPPSRARNAELWTCPYDCGGVGMAEWQPVIIRDAEMAHLAERIERAHPSTARA